MCNKSVYHIIACVQATYVSLFDTVQVYAAAAGLIRG